MSEQIPLTGQSRADDPEIDRDNDDSTHEIADDLAYKRLAIVNVVFVGLPGAGDREWVLIDAGLPGFAGAIKHAATERFALKSSVASVARSFGAFGAKSTSPCFMTSGPSSSNRTSGAGPLVLATLGGAGL